MLLQMMTWIEVESYLSTSKGILIAAGSTEQHGPIGLIGTDALCAYEIAKQVGEKANAIVAPPLAYTPAPFNTDFPGTISVPSDVFEELATNIMCGLSAQGFKSIYVINGHGANLEPLIAAGRRTPDANVRIKSWWDYPEVNELRHRLYADWEGMHATPSEIAMTQAMTGIVHHGAQTPPEKLSKEFMRAHAGDKHGPPEEHRSQFPDGRVGSHSALARPHHGHGLLEAAISGAVEDFSTFISHN